MTPGQHLGHREEQFLVLHGSCGAQKELILDKVTGRVNFPAALPGQRLGPGTVHSQMKVMPGHIREASMVALKKGTEVRAIILCAPQTMVPGPARLLWSDVFRCSA